MKTSKEYWENRYQTNNNSGSGSYGILCQYKASIINEFIIHNNIKNVIEFGCGDGNQLKEILCDKYYGIDVSKTIIDKCKILFKNDTNKKFDIYDNYNYEKFDLSLSLDVIYHLIENEFFIDYMFKLFRSSNKYVIIYSSNGDINENFANHILDRNFTKWIDDYINNFDLIQKINNPYKYDILKKDQINTSISDFYIYKKRI